jgi:hypothetical protein
MPCFYIKMATLTLREWQNTWIPEEQYIVQASTTDGLDGITAPSIGMCYPFVHFKGAKNVDLQFGPKSRLAMCAINQGTDVRRRGTQHICRKTIAETLLKNGFPNETIEADKYFTEIAKYRFVISPEGNGIDCHRHYEALMAKCIPIVEDSPLIRAKYGNAPILYTRDYSEITQEYLEQKYAEMLDQQWDFSRLLMQSWSPEEQLLMMYRGNFWCEKLAKKAWYQTSAHTNTHPFLDADQVPCRYSIGIVKTRL